MNTLRVAVLLRLSSGDRMHNEPSDRRIRKVVIVKEEVRRVG